MLKRTLLAAFFASALGGITLPAAAHVTVDVAPPAPRHEPIPHHRHGYVWESGHWRWNGHRYVWIPGHWERVRHGYRHVPPRGVERDGAGNTTPAAGIGIVTAFRIVAIATATETAYRIATTGIRTTGTGLNPASL